MATAAHLYTGSSRTGQQTPAAPSQPQQCDLTPLFYSVLTYVTVEPGEQGMKPIAIAEGIVQQSPDVLPTFQTTPFAKICGQFDAHLQIVDNRGQVEAPMFQVLQRLYGISLENSSIKELLVQRDKDLPKLQTALKPTLKNDIQSALQQARTLLKGPNGVDQIAQVDSHLRHLHEYRALKHFTDADENQRVLDLASLYHAKGVHPQYPRVISDYPGLVQQIQSLQNELKQVSDAVVKLNALKMQLQKTQVEVLSATKSLADPLQTCFIDAYSTPFYDAFAWHFWDIVWNSQHEPDVIEATKKISDWSKAEHNCVDYGILNRLWTNFFPEYELSDWMLKTLKTIDSGALKTLEGQLGALHKKYNENRESPAIGKEDKAQILQSISQEMKMLCLEATEPSFSTVTELKGYLTPNG